jgi:hypothetical protein
MCGVFIVELVEGSAGEPPSRERPIYLREIEGDRLYRKPPSLL